MLSQFKFNLSKIASDAFVRHFIEENDGSIDKSGWIMVDKDNKELESKDRDRFVNIQFLVDVVYYKRLFPIDRYLLFNPLDSGSKFESIGFNLPSSLNFDAIVNKKIYLGSIGNKILGLEKITTILESGGATVYSKAENLDVLLDMDFCIFNTAFGEDFLYAFENNLTFGNSYWLMTLISYGYTDPNSLQFFKPFPHKNAGFSSNILISCTNVDGNARDYLIKLCKAMDVQYTGDLSKQCTHLICGALHGKKYDRAISWGIQLVNVLWIEDCFTNWSFLDPTLTKYQHISKILKANEILGTTPYSPTLLKEAVDNERARLQRSTVETPPKRIPIKSSIDVLPDFTSKLATPASTHLFMKPPNSQTPNTSLLTMSMQETAICPPPKEEAEIVDAMQLDELSQNEQEIGPVQSFEVKEDHKVEIIKEVVAEHKKPKKTSKTSHKLQEIPESSSPIIYSRKRSASQSGKRKRNNSAQPVSLMFTKGEATTSQARIMDQLGFSLIRHFKQCTHLVADSIKTTEKFLSAVGLGKQIITPLWITASGKLNKAQSEDDYRPKSDLYPDLDLSLSIKRAQTQPILQGYRIVISKSKSLPPVDILTNIVTANGGKVVKMIKSSDIKETIYICGTDKESDSLREEYPGLTVFTKEGLFKCILYQNK